jgi:hypothetical protein
MQQPSLLLTSCPANVRTMSTPWPAPYRIFFTVFEPAVTLGGVVMSVFQPAAYHRDLIPLHIATPPKVAPTASIMAIRQLGSCTFLRVTSCQTVYESQMGSYCRLLLTGVIRDFLITPDQQYPQGPTRLPRTYPPFLSILSGCRRSHSHVSSFPPCFHAYLGVFELMLKVLQWLHIVRSWTCRFTECVAMELVSLPTLTPNQ